MTGVIQKLESINGLTSTPSTNNRLIVNHLLLSKCARNNF